MKFTKSVLLACLFMLLASVGVRADEVDALLADLASGDSNKQILAVMTLRQVSDPRVTKAVIARAADPTASATIRAACINIIRTQKLTDGLATLLDIAGNSEQPFAVRNPAIAGVVELSGSAHVDLLLKLVRDDKSTLVKQSAAAALGSTGDPKVIPLIVPLFDSPDTAHQAVLALAATRDPAVVPILIDKLKTDNNLLRESIITALGRLADKRAVPPLLELLKENSELQRVLVINALGHLDDPAVVSRLAAFLADKTASLNVRTQAVLAIDRLKAASTMPTVAAVAAAPGEDITLRMAATRTLGSFGDEAIPTLIPLLDDKAVGDTAALSLSKITGAFFKRDREAWTKFYNEYKTRKQPTPR